MATELSRGSLFAPELVKDLINKVAGHSSIAKLTGMSPIAFNGQKEFIFTMDSDVDVVAENGKKSHGGISLDPVTIIPVKVEYGARISDEFMMASEEEKINILKAFNEGFAIKVARGLDLMAFHGINPRTKTASTVIGTNHFDAKVTSKVDFTPEDPDANIETAVGMVQGEERDVTGLAIDPLFANALAKYKVNGVKQFPELAWGASPDTLKGLKTNVNRTVAGGITTNPDVAIIGDFANSFKWGYAGQIPFEVIKYGDPDNSGNDLKGHNQVYLRAETFLGWGILDPKAFARIVKKG